MLFVNVGFPIVVITLWLHRRMSFFKLLAKEIRTEVFRDKRTLWLQLTPKSFEEKTLDFHIFHISLYL